MSPRLGFLIGLPIGIGLGIAALLVHQHYEEPLPPPRTKIDEDAHQWLLPRPATLTDIFHKPEALYILEAPESITVHRAGKGNLSVGRNLFQEGRSPSSRDAEILRTIFRSMNTYAPRTACAFNPNYLIRFQRGEHHLNLMICFTCEDLIWQLDDETDNLGSMMHLTALGMDSLRAVFSHLYPNDKALYYFNPPQPGIID